MRNVSTPGSSSNNESVAKKPRLGKGAENEEDTARKKASTGTPLGGTPSGGNKQAEQMMRVSVGCALFGNHVCTLRCALVGHALSVVLGVYLRCAPFDLNLGVDHLGFVLHLWCAPFRIIYFTLGVHHLEFVPRCAPFRIIT